MYTVFGMTDSQIVIIAVGMTASLYIGFQMGWSSAFRKIDQIIEEHERQDKLKN